MSPPRRRQLRTPPAPGIHAVFDEVERAIPVAFDKMAERARLLLQLRFVVLEDRGVTSTIVAGPPRHETIAALSEADRAVVARALRAAADALLPNP